MSSGGGDGGSGGTGGASSGGTSSGGTSSGGGSGASSGGGVSSDKKQPPEVFVLFASMGNIVMLLKAMADVWEISNQLRVVANAPLLSARNQLSLKGNDNTTATTTSGSAEGISSSSYSSSSSSSTSSSSTTLQDGIATWGNYSFVRVLRHMKQEVDTSLLLRDWSIQPTATTEDQPTLTSTSAITTTSEEATADNFTTSSSSSSSSSSRELYRLWSALHFLLCASHSRPVLNSLTPDSTPPTAPSENDIYRFGDGITVAGCVLLHLMGEQNIYELCDVSQSVLNAYRFETHSRPIDAVMGLGNKKQLSKFARDKNDFFGMMQAWTTGGKSESFEQQRQRGVNSVHSGTSADRRGSHTSTTSDVCMMTDGTIQLEAEQFVMTAMTQRHIQQQLFAFLHATDPHAPTRRDRVYRPPKE